MRIVLPGGSGQVGRLLARSFAAEGHEVVVLARSASVSVPASGSNSGPGPDALGDSATRTVPWDGRTVADAWAREIDGSDVVVNLAGRSVNCRYTEQNLRDMLDSRVDSTRAVGEAIARAARPPRVWLQMSTATIYAHRFDAPNDERSGIIGGSEPDVPAYWSTSIRIAQAWEEAQSTAATPGTRKVALRSTMVMSPQPGGIFDVLLGLVRKGLGGSAGSGQQFVSWIHERDFVRAVNLLIARDDVSGAVNVASPNPLPYRDFMRALRQAWGTGIGLPATEWMLAIGAFFLRTDTELVLKSRRVIPGRLFDLGFTFEQPTWPEAVAELVARWRVAR